MQCGKLRVKCHTIIQQERDVTAPAIRHRSVTSFEFYRFRFHFRALGRVHFPQGKSSNAVRGAFGTVLRQSAAPEEYARLFEPGTALGKSPSGLADWPRPLVFRAAHLDGTIVAPGCGFFVDVHVFDVRTPVLPSLRAAFGEFGRCGIGPGRGRAELLRVEQLDLADAVIEVDDAPGTPSTITFEPAAAAVEAVSLRFVTPTELKAEGGTVERPEFAVLFGRLRDRISTLRALYGAGPLDIDFRGLGERAARVHLQRSALHWERVLRRSGRTGQIHSLAGFTGEVSYAGALGEFLPWLRAGRWVGVGRHTVWGKGDFRVVP